MRRISITFMEQQYNYVRSHLFKGKQEQGCFLFASSSKDNSSIEVNIKDVHLIETGGWSFQSGFHLELREEEKVRVMQKARKLDCDLIECHSHRFNGAASFSPSDVQGLGEFVQYIWWKLPGKIYGAVVFTKSDINGQIWLPKQTMPVPISEIRIIDSKGDSKVIGKTFTKKSLFNIFKRRNYD